MRRLGCGASGPQGVTVASIVSRRPDRCSQSASGGEERRSRGNAGSAVVLVAWWAAGCSEAEFALWLVQPGVLGPGAAVLRG